MAQCLGIYLWTGENYWSSKSKCSHGWWMRNETLETHCQCGGRPPVWCHGLSVARAIEWVLTSEKVGSFFPDVSFKQHAFSLGGNQQHGKVWQKSSWAHEKWVPSTCYWLWASLLRFFFFCNTNKSSSRWSFLVQWLDCLKFYVLYIKEDNCRLMPLPSALFKFHKDYCSMKIKCQTPRSGICQNKWSWKGHFFFFHTFIVIYLKTFTSWKMVTSHFVTSDICLAIGSVLLENSLQLLSSCDWCPVKTEL